MNIAARVFGVLIYFFTLISVCLLIQKCKKDKVKRVLFIYSIILSFMGFFFVPNINNDLYRIYDIMDSYSTIPFADFFNKYVVKSNVPVSLIYYWTIGQFKINGLLPFFTTLIVYTNIFYIAVDYYKKNNISNKTLALSILIIMCNSSFFETISGIRNMLAFSILLRCFYSEAYNNRSIIKNLVFYIISALIHPATIVLILLRLIFSLIEKRTNSKFKKTIPALLVCLVVFLFFSGNAFIQNAIYMSESYIHSVEYSYIWETFLSFLILLFLVFMKIDYKKSNLNNNVTEGLINNKKFSQILEFIIFLFISKHSIFFRFNNFNLFLNIPIILAYCGDLDSKDKRYRFIFLYFIFILIVSCIRGNLCSLKFWE